MSCCGTVRTIIEQLNPALRRPKSPLSWIGRGIPQRKLTNPLSPNLRQKKGESASPYQQRRLQRPSVKFNYPGSYGIVMAECCGQLQLSQLSRTYSPHENIKYIKQAILLSFPFLYWVIDRIIKLTASAYDHSSYLVLTLPLPSHFPSILSNLLNMSIFFKVNLLQPIILDHC